MFPLDVVLIGRNQEVLEAVRRELTANDAAVCGEFPDVTGTLGSEDPSTRRLYLLHIAEPDDLRQLQKLVRTYAGQPVLAVVPTELQEEGDSRFTPITATSSAVGRASTFIQAMRAGAMQVVTLPIEPEDFRSAMECLARQFHQPNSSTVIAVSGVQGGCGATTLAMNLAHAISERSQQPCVLAELTPHAGMLATYLNIKPECTLSELLDREHLDTQTIKQALMPVTPRLSVLCGPYRDIVVRDSSERPVSPFDTLSVMEALRRLAPAVVVDVPAWFDETYFEVLRKADKIVLVAEQTVSSLHNLQMVERALALNERQTLDVIVNRYDPHVKGLSLEDIKRLSKGTVHKLGPDPAMLAAANEGRLLRETSPRSRLVAELEELAGFLITIPERPKNAGFWEKILGRSGQHAAEGRVAL